MEEILVLNIRYNSNSTKKDIGYYIYIIEEIKVNRSKCYYLGH